MIRALFLLLAMVGFTTIPSAAWAWPIPDTGQTTCYGEAGTVIDCAGTGQDGEYLINPPSYTKLDANGNDLLESAPSWAMVRDNVTGLIWEVKTNDGSIHDKDNQYTWYCPDCPDNGGEDGTPGDGTDTEDFIAALNAGNGFGGFTDWRMPMREELRSIADCGRFDPTIDTGYFPYTVSSHYWSSSTNARYPGNAWHVNFYYGYSDYGSKSQSRYFRAVRGGQDRSLGHWVIGSGDTVTDTRSGLMWRKTTDPAMSWTEAKSHCENMTTAGYDDWRLPTVKELASIAALDRWDPSIDTSFFSDTVSSNYWSSSTYAYNLPRAWSITFYHGYDFEGLEWTLQYVRAVRGGQVRLLGHLVISNPTQASVWYTGCPMEIEWDTQGIAGDVKISLSRDGGLTFEVLAASTPNDGQFLWTVSGQETVNTVLQIENLVGEDKSTSVGMFSILDWQEGLQGLPGGNENSPMFEPPELSQLSFSGNNPTNSSTLFFEAIFFTPNILSGVTGVDAEDFSIQSNGVTGAKISNVTGDGFTYNIEVSGFSGEGDIQLNFVADCSVKDEEGVPVINDVSGPVVVIDNTPPSAPSITGPAITKDSSPNWTWFSNGGGEGVFRYKLDDSNLNSGADITLMTSFHIAAISDGSHTLYVQERDNAGNWSASGSFVTVVDQGAPCSSITSAPPVISGGPITILYEAQDRFLGEVCYGSGSGVGLSSVALFIKGPGQTEFVPAFGIEDRTGNFDGRLSFYPSVFGVYEFYTLATDQAGNVESPPAVADDATSFEPTADARVWAEPSFLEMAEDADQGFTVTVKPSETPSAPVNVSLSLSNTGRCVLDKSLVTINDQSGATFQITPLDNETVDDTHLVYVNFGQTVSDDPDFKGLTISPVGVFLTEDDVGILEIDSIQPSFGPDSADLIVTVTGSGFSEATAVYLSGNVVGDPACVVLSVSNREMIVRVPRQLPGDYDLRFVNPGKEVFYPNAVSFIAELDYEKLRAKRAVLVAGGGAYDGNAFWDDATGAVAIAYKALVHQGYKDDRIQLLSPTPLDVDGDGNSEVDDIVSESTLRHAITEWPLSEGAPVEGELLFYFVGHGGTAAIELTQDEDLPIQTLDGWFDDLQTSPEWRQTGLNRIIAVFESCYSGAFLAALNPPPTGTERIVIASASENQDAWSFNEGQESFSGFFWKGVRYTGELYQSFLQGDGAIGTASRVDTDGDGEHEDFILEDLETGNPAKIFIGLRKSSASPLAVIEGVEPPAEPMFQISCGVPMILRATGVSALNGISSVYARIFEPGEFDESIGKPKGDDEGTQVYLLPESDINNGIYEGESLGFTRNGTYSVWVYATDKKTDISSEPKRSFFKVHSCPEVFPGDIDGVNGVNLQDAIVGLQVLAGRTDAAVRADFPDCGADVGSDGKVGLADVIFVLRKVADI